MHVQILANYQGVTFDQISYDETTNLVNIWTHVMLRPWPLYWRGNIPLSIFTVLELEDVEQVSLKQPIINLCWLVQRKSFDNH